jgi:hypothetical protein
VSPQELDMVAACVKGDCDAVSDAVMASTAAIQHVEKNTTGKLASSSTQQVIEGGYEAVIVNMAVTT